MSATVSSCKAYPEPFCRHTQLLQASKNCGFFPLSRNTVVAQHYGYGAAGKPELTKILRHLFYCRAMWPDGHTFQRLSKTHALQRLPLASFDQTDRMEMSRDYAGLMLCRQLKSMNWIKTQMLVCFDGIFCLFFFWLRCFLEISCNQLLICSCVGLCCLWFLYFAALTCWPAWLILCLNLCPFILDSSALSEHSFEKQKSIQFRGPVRSRL